MDQKLTTRVRKIILAKPAGMTLTTCGMEEVAITLNRELPVAARIRSPTSTTRCLLQRLRDDGELIHLGVGRWRRAETNQPELPMSNVKELVRAHDAREARGFSVALPKTRPPEQRPAVPHEVGVLNGTPSRPATPEHERLPVHPAAPVLTIELFNSLLTAKAQTGHQYAFTIYPDVALYIRDNCSGYNRKVHATKMRDYSLQMQWGRWRLDGNPIQFSNQGKMTNGQHRNGASILSNKPYAVYMSFGHDPEDYKTMDQGVIRRAQDLFHQNEWHYPNTAAYATTWIMRYKGDNQFLSRATPRPEDQLCCALGYGKEKLTRCIKTALAIKKTSGIPAQYVAAVYYLARELSPAAADKFFGAWSEGGAAQLPIQRKLVNRIRQLRTAASKSVLDTIQFAMIINAWNAHAKGGQHGVKDLDWSPLRTVAGETLGCEPPVVMPAKKG